MLQPFDPLSVLLIAALNPAVIVVGYLMGRAATQWQKIPIAGFAAAIAGAGVVWVATYLKILPAHGIGGEGGTFVLGVLFGALWAAIGYRMRRRA